MKENRKVPYEEAKLEVVLIDAQDVITTSSFAYEDDPNADPNGWC